MFTKARQTCFVVLFFFSWWRSHIKECEVTAAVEEQCVLFFFFFSPSQYNNNKPQIENKNCRNVKSLWGSRAASGCVWLAARLVQPVQHDGWKANLRWIFDGSVDLFIKSQGGPCKGRISINYNTVEHFIETQTPRVPQNCEAHMLITALPFCSIKNIHIGIIKRKEKYSHFLR